MFTEPLKKDLPKLGKTEGQFVNQLITISPDLEKQVLSYVKKVHQNIQSLEFPKLEKRDERKCKWCNYDSVCWG